MLVSEVIDDIKDTFGMCANEALYRRLTDAVRMLSNKGGKYWDGLLGYMTVSVDSDTNTITLPRDVLTPLEVNFDDYPTFGRDRWFEFHLNGPGGGAALKYDKAWDDKGFYPTFRTFTTPSQITAIPDGTETGKTITIIGYDTDDREVSETIDINFATPAVTTQVFASVTRVLKDSTDNPVKLYTYVGGSVNTLIGWYYPDEKEPQYRRIRVSARENVTMLYRRKTLDLTNENDYIPLQNRLAVVQACRAVKYRYENMLQEALIAEQDALNLLEEEQGARNIETPVGPQILNLSSYNEERLHEGDLYWR